MSHLRVEDPTAHPSVARAVLALLPPLMALIDQLAIWPWLRPYGWFLFYPAIFLSARMGGLRASVIATGISTALVLWFFVPPEHSFAHKQAKYFPAAVFLLVGIVSGVLRERERKASDRMLTEVSRLYEETRLAEERADLAIRGGELGTWDWNVQTGDVVLSPGWHEARGYQPGELPPRIESWRSRVHPDDWSHVNRALTDYLEGRAPAYEVEYRSFTRSGEWKWFTTRGKVFTRDEQGRPVRMAGTSLDINERKRLEEALLLRNPLGTILMQSSTLRRRGPEPERRSPRPADNIERAARRMSRLIEDLLDVTRMESGHLTVEQHDQDTKQIVTESIEAHKALAAAASLELRPDVAESLPEIFADRDRLLQVLENLVGNAIKFTEPGGTIIVGATPREREVAFWVADTGPGIAAEDMAHLFERFWQAPKAGRRGAGLGLPIVKGIVEAHGGRVWVENVPGHGSTFFFTMPVSQSARGSPRPPALDA